MIDAATVAVVAICMTLVSFFTQAKPTDTTPGEKVEAVQCTGCPADGQAATAAPMAAPMAAAAEAPAPAATAMATPAATPAPADVTPIAPMAQVVEAPAPVQVAAAEPADAKKPATKGGKAAKGKPAAAAAATSEAASASAPAADAAAPGFHINVGLFAVPTNAHNAYQKLVGAGFAAYTQEITSKTKGKLTRVRVGPFASRAEADAAADKIHGLQLEAVVFQR